MISGREAQAIIDAAGRQAVDEFLEAVARLPRWKRWLYRKVAPRWPVISAPLPSEEILLTEPLVLGQGVMLTNALCRDASESQPQGFSITGSGVGNSFIECSAGPMTREGSDG